MLPKDWVQEGQFLMLPFESTEIFLYKQVL